MRDWTPEQQKAIDTTDRTVLLSAAAGSGKTATLIQRLIQMITRDEDPLDVSRMLVVTFSRAAAAELRERIAASVAEKQAADPTNERLLRASLLLPSAAIRTINSFCHDLVKGHAQELGIPPHYRILDEAEAKLLSRELMDGVITDAYDGRYAPSGMDVGYLADSMTEARHEEELTAKLVNLYKDLGGYPDGIGLLRETLTRLAEAESAPFFETPWGEVIRDHISDVLSEYKTFLQKARDGAEAEGSEVYIKKLASPLADMEDDLSHTILAARDGYDGLKKALLSFPLPTLSSPKDLPPEAGLAKRLGNEIKEAIKKLRADYFAWDEKDIPFAARATARLLRSVILLLEEFDRRYMAEKRRICAYTFSDLEHFAYALLYTAEGERTPLAHSLSEAYDAICIDEYQDVNDLQHLVFVAIARPTTRFMVGDIKQSIYAFRGAKPSIFARLRAEMPAYEDNKEEAVLYLTRNFRSHGHLIKFNNAVFDFVFEAFKESIGYRAEDALHQGRADARKSLPLPEVIYPYTPKGEEKTVTEWDIVAERIKQLIDYGAKENGERILPSDIAVLYKSGTEKPVLLAEALRQRGVPVLSKDTRNFFENPEILLALCLLHTVNNPHRDIYLAGLLRSPLYRFRLEELLAIRDAESGSLFDALRAYTDAHPDFEKGRLFLKELASFRAVCESERTDKLCRILFEKTGLYALTDAEGKKRLESLYDYARGYEATSYRGLYRFLSHLNDLYESGGSLGAERILGEAEGVEIMTMHHSKGLEFPVCFIVDTKVIPHPPKDTVPFHPALGIGSDIRDESGLAILKNPFALALDILRKREELEESARVLYVALTRASEQMYISAHGTALPENVYAKAEMLRAFPTRYAFSSNHFFEWVLAASIERSDLSHYKLDESNAVMTYLLERPFPRFEGEEDDGAKKEEGPDKGGQTADTVERIREELEKRFSFVYPHEAEASLPGKVSVSMLYPSYLDEDESEAKAALARGASAPTEAEDEKKETATVPFFLSGVEGDLALKAGIATHLFLQFCDFAALCGETDEEILAAIEKECARLEALGFLHETDVRRVRIQEILGFVKSDLQKEILSARSIRREFRFNTWLPADRFTEDEETKKRYEALSLFTQGVIDLLIETKEGEVILADYKTDRLTREMLASDEKAAALLLKRYRSQLSYYALAVERILGKKPKRIVIYSLHAGKCFSVSE